MTSREGGVHVCVSDAKIYACVRRMSIFQTKKAYKVRRITCHPRMHIKPKYTDFGSKFRLRRASTKNIVNVRRICKKQSKKHCNVRWRICTPPSLKVIYPPLIFGQFLYIWTRIWKTRLESENLSASISIIHPVSFKTW